MNTNGLPPWVKIISVVGFPIAVAVYLFVVLYPLIQDTQAKVADHVKKVEEQTALIVEQTRVLKIICRNTAENSFEKASCDK